MKQLAKIIKVNRINTKELELLRKAGYLVMIVREGGAPEHKIENSKTGRFICSWT